MEGEIKKFLVLAGKFLNPTSQSFQYFLLLTYNAVMHAITVSPRTGHILPLGNFAGNTDSQVIKVSPYGLLKILGIGINRNNFGFGYLNVEERRGHSRSLNLVIHTPILLAAKYSSSFPRPRSHHSSITGAERPANLCSTTLVL